jgi:thioredoxin reductase (NADPH)
VADRIYKQAVTAAGSGCAAAMDAEKYVSEFES